MTFSVQRRRIFHGPAVLNHFNPKLSVWSTVEIDCFLANARNIVLSVGINDEMSQRLVLLQSEIIGTEIPDLTFGRHNFRFNIPRMPLVPGRYRLTLHASINGIVADWIQNASLFYVEGGDFYGTGRLSLPGGGGGFFLRWRQKASRQKRSVRDRRHNGAREVHFSDQRQSMMA